MDNTATKKGLASAGLPDNLARKLLLSVLPGLADGHLSLIDGDKSYEFGNKGSDLHATLVVKHPRFYREILLSGSIGAGEAYIQNHWTSPDLTKVVQIFARNLPLLDKLEQKLSWITTPFSRIAHLFNRNTQAGSRQNILAHYDLGNDMYQAFLDKEMLYSSALYPHADASLDEAQQHKLKTICERLDLTAGQTLLEVGTGWGALAIYAAKHYGVKVTTTTISDAQFEYAKSRVALEDLAGSVTLLKDDYRILTGEYDRVVSIEMIEAVGHEYLPGFFKKLQALLKPNGRLLIQAITIADQRYNSYRKSVDFIQRYIFPGGCLPSVTRMTNEFTKHTDFVTWSVDDMGLDYAKTVKDWQDNFDAALPKIKALGYGDDFIRMWKFYLSYCEGGFLERTTSTVHLVAVRPQYRPPQ